MEATQKLGIKKNLNKNYSAGLNPTQPKKQKNSLNSVQNLKFLKMLIDV
jgi:hypothetical protein